MVKYKSMDEERGHATQLELRDYDVAVLEHHKNKPLDALGREVLDPTPMAPPVGYKKTPSMFDIVRDQVAAARRMEADEQPGSFEEEDDFDVGDDYEPSSPWEMTFDHVPVEVLRQRLEDDAKRAQELPKPNTPAVGEGGDGGPAPKPGPDAPPLSE